MKGSGGAALAVILFLVGACSTVVPSSQSPAAVTPAPASPSLAATATPATPSPTKLDLVVRDGEPWILYQKLTEATDEIKLRLIRPDGTGDHALLDTGLSDQIHPDWSPDGSRIAFVIANEIWVVGADGNNAVKVAPCISPCVYGDHPAWSPDGRTIAFVSVDGVDGAAPSSVVSTVDPATGSITKLFETESPEYAAYPRWSPDGQAMVVELDTYADTQVTTSRVLSSVIAVWDLRSPTPEKSVLTAPDQFAAYPDWSPVGDQIVFSTYDLSIRDSLGFDDPTPPSNLYTINPDGTGLTRITNYTAGRSLIRRGTASGALASQPSWTPDGARIIFTLVEGDTWPGWLMSTINPDGAGLGPAAGTPRLGTHPRLRPVP